jgi:uncharacterized membrane protein
MSEIEAKIVIERPVDEVFSFYRNFKNLPRFLGDVIDVEPIDSVTSHWTIEGPLGVRVHWMTKVTEERTDKLIRYETITSPPLKTFWEIYFAAGPRVGETTVREVMKVPFGTLGRAALALIGKPPNEEIAANLHRLKQIIETGRVTDMSYAVAGKFAPRNHRARGSR